MDSAKLLIAGGLVLGGIYLLDKNKKDKENAQAMADAQALALANAKSQMTLPPTVAQPVDDLSGFYTPTQATQKALEVVTKWISLLDAIPKEALTEENKNVINQRIAVAREKEARLGYEKALTEAKSKNLPKFTFLDETYYTATEENIKTTPNNYFVNSYKYRSSTDEAILDSRTAIFQSMMFANQPKTLGDYVKFVKTQQFSNVYDVLKEAFTKIPKSDVNRLVVLLPKYLMMGNDDFTYFQTQYEKNPFTIEEQLYLKDVGIDQLLSPKKTINIPNLAGIVGQSMAQPITMYK
jgi:hypothetical protein